MNLSGTCSFFLVLSVAYAADGIITDPSGRPVPLARITCGAATAASDSEGHFAVPGACLATVTKQGFEPRKVELKADGTTRVELEIARNSERVIVSANRLETTPEQAGVAATIVTKADLTARQSPAVADVLQEIPGMQIVRYGRPGSLTQFYTRAGQRTATMVMIDGVPVNDPGGELNLAGFSTSGIERMEVIRGPESAAFGADAASGVIQLFTQRGDPETRIPHGSVSYDRGSFQTDRFLGNITGGAGDRFDYSFGGEQFHTVGEYANDFFRNTSGTANLGYRIAPSTDLRGVFRSFDSMIGTPNQVGYGIFAPRATEATRDTLASVTLNDARGSHFVQRIHFGYHRSRDLFDDPAGVGPDTVAALVRDVWTPVHRVYLVKLVDPNTVAPDGLRLVTHSDFPWPSDPYLSLTSRKDFEYQGTLAHRKGATVFGYEYERQDAEISGRAMDRNNHAVFLHEQYAPTERLYLSGGVRFEQNSAFHTKVTPRGAASYRILGEHGVLSQTYLRASAGVGITEPSLLQNYARDAYSIGNPALRPEKTISYDAGVVQEWFNRRVRTEVSAFHNTYKDLIIFVSAYPAASTWQNIEGSRSRGLEFSTRAKVYRYVTVNGSYTRLWTRITKSTTPTSIFTGVGQELARRPGNSGSVSMTIAPRRWTLAAGTLLVGERQDTDTLVFGVTRNPGYQNVYVAGSYELTKHFVPYLRVGNLLDQRYEEILGYPAASRNIHGGLKIQW